MKGSKRIELRKTQIS